METIVQREQITLGVPRRATVSLLATPCLEKPKGNEGPGLLLEQKGPFPAGVQQGLTCLPFWEWGFLGGTPLLLDGHAAGKGSQCKASAWELKF